MLVKSGYNFDFFMYPTMDTLAASWLYCCHRRETESSLNRKGDSWNTVYIQDQSPYIKTNGECTLKHSPRSCKWCAQFNKQWIRGRSEISGNRWEFLRDGSRIWGASCMLRLFVCMQFIIRRWVIPWIRYYHVQFRLYRSNKNAPSLVPRTPVSLSSNSLIKSTFFACWKRPQITDDGKAIGLGTWKRTLYCKYLAVRSFRLT